MFSCSTCTASDPATDTVRVALVTPNAEDKENCNTPNISAEAQLNKKAVDERRYQEDVGAEKAEEERRESASAEAQEEERRRLREEERIEEHKKWEAAEAERAARTAHLHEAARRIRQQREEEERLIEQRLQYEAEQRREREAVDSVKLQAFLKQHGYKDAKTKRTKLFKSKYPLHSAVKLNDANVVKLLLEQGADPAATNSAGQTPATVAQNLQRDGSHEDVLAMLEGC
eukprot:TRINITY_DN1398_c0_g1_i1.p1 TRINITY_DN1398_c0_g1~~TRINITY_DN1398_c0_g1_i1.p1  ORF type:complete len:230 (+),score=49.15 TRINITY_DN1398_c0_g1_i1:70-759(+)